MNTNQNIAEAIKKNIRQGMRFTTSSIMLAPIFHIL